MKKNSKYRQGIFVPTNLDKFIGERAVYRSGLELKFFRFCDNNANVLKWGSENIKIPYFNKLTGVVIREGDQVTKYCVEIKPYKQTLPPTTKYKKKSNLIYEQKAYVTNQCKWEAAKKYCEGRGYKFLILTEREIT